MRRVGWRERRERWWLAAWLIPWLFSAVEVDAQLPVKVWARPLVAVPIGEFRGEQEGVAAGTSFGLDAGGSVSFGSLRLYGEYQEIDFDCGECPAAGLEESVLDRGWGAGVIVPVLGNRSGIAPWMRLGVIGHHLRIRSADESAYSGRSLGVAIGGGAEVRPLPWLTIEPTVLLRSYDASFGFAIDVPDRDLSVTYLAFGLAVAIAP